MKILTVVGARPQFVKAAVVSPALRDAGVEESLLDTGQHYDPEMSAVFYDELTIPAPDWSLGIGSGAHGAQTGAMLAGIERVVVDARPDVVMVYGDTNSTLAGALAASKLHVPVAHVEAGLRSFNRAMPEEINRVVADHLSAVLFTPSETAVANLAAEGITAGVIPVGDVMFDLALRAAAVSERSDVLSRLGLTEGAFHLVTVHRAENTDNRPRFDAIVDALARVALECPVIWPVHPRIGDRLEGRDLPDGLRLVPPVGYLDMVRLERSCAVVITDSGGVQKEAFFHRRPCVVVRDETEWVELVDLGWVELVPPVDAASIATAVKRAVGRTGSDGSPYGDGDAAMRIAAALAGAGI